MQRLPAGFRSGPHIGCFHRCCTETAAHSRSRPFPPAYRRCSGAGRQRRYGPAAQRPQPPPAPLPPPPPAPAAFAGAAVFFYALGRLLLQVSLLKFHLFHSVFHPHTTPGSDTVLPAAPWGRPRCGCPSPESPEYPPAAASPRRRTAPCP